MLRSVARFGGMLLPETSRCVPSMDQSSFPFSDCCFRSVKGASRMGLPGVEARIPRSTSGAGALQDCRLKTSQELEFSCETS